MVGEIRDPETADIAIQSALTGHLVFTTVHANNVIDVLGRFLNMKIEPYNFVSALNCVQAQRLVRTICEHCKRAGAAPRTSCSSSRASTPRLYADVPFYEGAGCIECGGTGYKGRTAICELLDVTDTIRELILARRSSAEIKRAAREEGMIFLRESAVEQGAGRARPRCRRSTRSPSWRSCERDRGAAGSPLRRAGAGCRARSSSRRCRWWRSRCARARLAAVRLAREGGRLALAAAAAVELPAGALERRRSRKPNVVDPEAFRAALHAGLERAGALSGGPVSLVLPDPAIRLTLVPSLGLRGRRGELEETVRFRLHKALPADFDVRSARLAWRAVSPDELLVAVARDEVGPPTRRRSSRSASSQGSWSRPASRWLLSTATGRRGPRACS